MGSIPLEVVIANCVKLIGLMNQVVLIMEFGSFSGGEFGP